MSANDVQACFELTPFLIAASKAGLSSAYITFYTYKEFKSEVYLRDGKTQ